MALLHYMTVLQRRNAELPDPAGPLSSSVPSTAIEQANAAVARVRQDEAGKTNAKSAVEFFAYGSVSHIDVYVVATNATLSLHTGLQPRAPPEIVDTRLQRVKILPGKNLAVYENKTGENLTLYSCDGFGAIFFWRKFPTIR